MKSSLYGTWDSPITADLLTQKVIELDDILVDPATSKIYHVESRPDEQGRNAIVDSLTGKDIFGRTYNARTSVHEYGGTASLVYENIAYFANLPDKNIYRLDLSGEASPVPITPENPNWRYANFTLHPIHTNFLITILEDHTNPEPSQVLTRLSVIDTSSQSKAIVTLAQGADFYSSPTTNPSGTHIAYVQWFHPDMPWEGGELVIAPISIVSTSSGSGLELGTPKVIAGKREVYSAQQPEWLSDDKLLYLSDQTGFINPYAYDLSSDKTTSVLPKPLDEDFGEPPWSLGSSSYAILNPTTAIYTSIKDGRATLYKLNLTNGFLTDLQTPFVELSRMRRISDDYIVFKGKKTTEAETLVQYTLSTGTYTTLKETSTIISTLPKGIVSIAKPFSFPIPPSNESVHVLFYAPTNPEYADNKDEKPPCIVHIHGGPTSRTPAGLSWDRQYFTSRGWAWLDVNYGGSSGYGTKYINRLRGQWGIVDVEDTIQAVTQLSARGIIDGQRVVIRGGSAGGFTVLSAVTTHPDFFAIGCSFFGISDLGKLAEFTHKFESQYLRRLVDPKHYKERSPINHADKIKAPLLILQGAEDQVVPPDQAKAMVDIIKKNNGVVKYIEFEGEGHGWRQAKSIKAALEAELAWYKFVFKLD